VNVPVEVWALALFAMTMIGLGLFVYAFVRRKPDLIPDEKLDAVERKTNLTAWKLRNMLEGERMVRR